MALQYWQLEESVDQWQLEESTDLWTLEEETSTDVPNTALLGRVHTGQVYITATGLGGVLET